MASLQPQCKTLLERGKNPRSTIYHGGSTLTETRRYPELPFFGRRRKKTPTYEDYPTSLKCFLLFLLSWASVAFQASLDRVHQENKRRGRVRATQLGKE
ncbi:hypothetical protein L596_002186 [Steinernema carpocapsae]|uniref:Uncharacterized protein n=1 Tax=Steinernema carpocapsae TaxID=34508 RepID=A0A4U8UNE5_STECR|nr:hypothetical protein L596_002186 [Steinernema carpocapsae]